MQGARAERREHMEEMDLEGENGLGFRGEHLKWVWAERRAHGAAGTAESK